MKVRKKLPYISRKKKLKKNLKKFCGLKKRTYLYIIKLTNKKKPLIMKKSTYAIAFGITIVFFATLAYIATQIIKLNGSLPIDFI